MAWLRGVGRLLGMLFRLCVWLLLWPLGWYLTHQARKRRRHNQLVRAVKAGSVGPIRTAAPGTARMQRVDAAGHPTGEPIHLRNVVIHAGPPEPRFNPQQVADEVAAALNRRLHPQR